MIVKFEVCYFLNPPSWIFKGYKITKNIPKIILTLSDYFYQTHVLIAKTHKV
jgi:hypothetical protein